MNVTFSELSSQLINKKLCPEFHKSGVSIQSLLRNRLTYERFILLTFETKRRPLFN